MKIKEARIPIRAESGVYFVDGFSFMCGGREVGVAPREDGAWTATDIKTGTALPVFNYFTEREDIIASLKEMEPTFIRFFRMVKYRERIAQREKELEEMLKGEKE